MVSTADGKSVSVELTTGATEGPFTAAALGAVTPADAATIKLVESGSEAARTFRLDVAPKVGFEGAITINYTLTNAFGTSSAATVSVTVTARPDPSADPLVRSISDAQAETVRRFARAQVDNFMRRAERLHGADCLPSGNGIRVTAIDMARDDDPRGGNDVRRDRNNGPEPVREGRTRHAGDATTAAASPSAVQACRPGKVAVWTGGAIELSTRDASTGATKIRATSSGLSAGIDTKVSDRVSVGVGVGYGKDRSRVGGDDGRVSAQSKVLAVYGSATPIDGMFVDGMVAQGVLDFDTRRLDSASGFGDLGGERRQVHRRLVGHGSRP
jgi:hypothetical protein